MKKYAPPRKEFLMLPNSVFDMPLDVYAFKIYAYLVLPDALQCHRNPATG